MGYDLDFWKYKKGIYSEHQHVYEQYSEGAIAEGLETLPVAAIRAAIKS